jgi:hypothetical protein
MCANATHIDHTDKLRAGATGSVLGHRVMAPSAVTPDDLAAVITPACRGSG